MTLFGSQAAWMEASGVLVWAKNGSRYTEGEINVCMCCQAGLRLGEADKLGMRKSKFLQLRTNLRP